MKKRIYNHKSIQDFIDKVKIATISQLKEVSGTATTMTVFRALKQLSYHSSCSHKCIFNNM